MNLVQRMDPNTLDLAMTYARTGAAFLDQVRPGWDTTVNLTKLRLASSQRCVLGQVYDADALEATRLYREKNKNDGWYANNPQWRISGYDHASDTLFEGDTQVLVEHGFLSEVETCCCDEDECDEDECADAAYYCGIHSAEVNDRDLIGYAHLDVVWSELLTARDEQRQAYETYAENIAFSEGYEEGYVDGQLSGMTLTTVTDIVDRMVMS